MYYPIKIQKKDFILMPDAITKGTRQKKIAIDLKENKIAFFKYEEYNCTEACSEKMAYEIAKVLEYPCAKVELARDENGTIGILDYLFVDNQTLQHIDAISYINKNNGNRNEFYTIENIKKCLDKIDTSLFYEFLKILIFDALIGETDRHEENWGILIENGKYKISPLYDNGCNLLREFKNIDFAKKYYNGEKSFESYIERSKSLIYNESSKKQYKHFELIKRLYKEYPEIVKKEINNMEKLTSSKIETIVNKIPKDLMENEHKQYIIKFIIERKMKLKNIIK